MNLKKVTALLFAMLMLFAAACAPQTPPAQSPDPSEAPGGTDGQVIPNSYTAGTYQSVQQGHNGFIDVSVTFSDTAITAIEVANSYETTGVSTKAISTELPANIIAKQSLNVDTITGATISSMAMLRAVEDCVKQAGGDPAALQVEEPAANPLQVEKAADVIIVGAGGSGLAAAVAAAEAGASVIIVEKVGYVGGNTLVSGGIYNAADPAMQAKIETSEGLEKLVTDAIAETPVSDAHKALIEKVKADFDAYKASGSKSLFDSPNWHALQTWNGGDKVADLALVENMTARALDCLEWLYTMGYEIKPDIAQGSGSLWQRTHYSVKTLGTGLIDAYMGKIAELNVEIFYNTRASELILTDGRVTGVKGTDTKGSSYTFTANKGVIISTGGFAGNPEIVQKYNTSGKWPDLSNTKNSNLPGMEGDGIVMLEAAGAALRDMDQIQLLQTCSVKNGKVMANCYPKGVASYLIINKEGNRYIREDGRRDDISLASLKQTDSMFYILQSAESIPDPENTKDLAGVPLSVLIETGEMFAGETLADVCAQVGIDAANVQKSVDAYNKAVEEKAAADEFGRALLPHKFETGPWYLLPRAPAVHHTMGGVTIDTTCHVLDAEGNAIPGVFAAGEVVGGIHGGNRLGGNAIVDTVVYGRIAGEEAAK